MAPQTSYFTDASMVRRVHREFAVRLAGPRTLLLQATHPVAFAGFFAHTGALDAPYERLARTARVMDAITFGPRAEADRLTRRVRAMHRRVRGELAEPAGRFPAGTPYAADDPELLLWILAPIVDSSLLVYEQVRAAAEPRRARRLLAGLQGRSGEQFGLRRTRDAGHDRGLRRLHGRRCSRAATSTSRRRRASWRSQIVMRPPVPLHLRPLLELVNQITVGLLPGEIRRGYGLSWDPARSVALHGGAEYVRRVIVPLLPARLRGRSR